MTLHAKVTNRAKVSLCLFDPSQSSKLNFESVPVFYFQKFLNKRYIKMSIEILDEIRKHIIDYDCKKLYKYHHF